WLLVRDPDAEDYTEHHQGGVLEYRFMPKRGLPFPALTVASGDFPELRVEPDDADEALEEVAFRLVDEWIWYDEEDAPLERERYRQYGYAVRGANLKSEKLAFLRRRAESHSTLDPAAAEARAALQARWLNRT